MAKVKDQPERSKPISLTVNGETVNAEINCRMTLAEFLREELDLTGTKVGCNRGECGSCTVLFNGRPVYSCSLLAVEASGCEIETIEVLLNEEELHPLQKTFVDHDALQCGYCTPGMIMSLEALLKTNSDPSEYDVRQAIDGNLCRCGAYLNIIDATIEAAAMIQGKGGN